MNLTKPLFSLCLYKNVSLLDMGYFSATFNNTTVYHRSFDCKFNAQYITQIFNVVYSSNSAVFGDLLFEISKLFPADKCTITTSLLLKEMCSVDLRIHYVENKLALSNQPMISS